MKTIAVATSGGDAPGMNPCVRAVVRTALNSGLQVKGIRRAYEGLVAGDFIDMGPRDVGGIIQKGGTVLMTGRFPEFNELKYQRLALRLGFQDKQLQAATQLIAAMAQLNFKIPMGGAPGTFEIETLRKYKKITRGTLLAESFPFPTKNNAKEFPGLKQYFRDMQASGKANLRGKNLEATSFNPWFGVLGFVAVTKDLESFTSETVTEALKTVQDVDLEGLTPPWTPSTPGFSVFTSSSNHFVFVSRFNGKNVVTKNDPIDITEYTG